MKEQKEKKAKESKPKRNIKKIVITSFSIILLLVASVFGYDYMKLLSSRVYIEKSEVVAPIITLTSTSTGILESIFVKEGDYVQKNMIIAYVGQTPIKAKTDGLIISVQNTPGQIISASGYVAKMIDPNEFRVVGKVQEDKGLSDIKIGQKVIFTIDTFGSKEYYGIVDSISPTSDKSDIVFSISDKRQESNFAVYVKYDINTYPELKNGMSAKMWVYK